MVNLEYYLIDNEDLDDSYGLNDSYGFETLNELELNTIKLLRLKIRKFIKARDTLVNEANLMGLDLEIILATELTNRQ